MTANPFRRELCTTFRAGVVALFASTSLFASGAHADEAKVESYVTGHFARPDIIESSGIAASQTQPGVYWTLNDSGGEPVVYAFDLNGRDLGAWLIEGGQNIDWEAISFGPCLDGNDTDCLYVADTGDNLETRESVSLYILPEPEIPVASEPGARFATSASRFEFRYDGGPRDVEGMYVRPDGTVWFVTKGRKGSAKLFSFAPKTDNGIAHERAVLFDTIDPEAGGLISDAALSADGQALAVMNYADLFVFALDLESGLPLADIGPTRCSLKPLAAPQGEGVTWYPLREAEVQVLTSEGPAGQIGTIACPRPVRK